MGHQLWMSPTTGYRRRGTRLAELRTLIEASITVRAVFEPLESCLADTPAAEAAALLKKRTFDVAGVAANEAGPVVGFVTRESLTSGTVESERQDITAEKLISEAAPLSVLMHVLRARPYAFVLIGNGVGGIVTRSDLDKPPVRVYLFALVSLLEMHMGFWIRATYRGESWQEHLSAPRLGEAKRLQALRRKRLEDSNLIHYIQFCDRRDLVIRQEELLERLGLGSRKAASSHLRQAEGLRNSLAHGQAEIAKGTAWKQVIDLVEWIEGVVHQSDDEVEKEALKRHGQGERARESV